MLNDTEFSKSAVESPDTGFEAGAEPPAAAPPVRFGRLALCVATASALALGVVGTVAYGVWFNHDQQAYADAMARARQALGTAAAAAARPALAKSIAPPRSATTAAQGTAGGMQAPAVRPVTTGAQVTAVAPATTSTQAKVDPPATAQMWAAAAAPDGEEGGKLASWSGPVTRPAAPTVSETVVADATPALAASAAAAAPPPNPASQQLASGRPGRDARLAQQDRRAKSAANARHKGSLFARMGSFFRRVSYRQHDTGSRQDTYSHP
ncbi:hypothetical protein P0D72_26860 [Paraburkholderia sediminicola]|uniref:hypothetical protein n=1 Tax=Paraburkholderia sediminicola TaxID=458836 RepID=UPI0038B84ED1